MSIWCSWEHIGTDAASGREPERGVVRSYANGFSNHHPDLTGDHERPAGIALAHIAPWCVPGHDVDCPTCGETHDHPEAGPWLRLEVAAPETLNFWDCDDDGNPAVESEGATVVLDEEAARSLRDDLTRWLDMPKVNPVEEGDRMGRPEPATGARGDEQGRPGVSGPPETVRPADRRTGREVTP